MIIQLIVISACGDDDAVGVSLNRSNSYQMTSVLSISRRQPTLVKCWKIASFFEKLIVVFVIKFFVSFLV